MKKTTGIMILFMVVILFLSSCDDLTRNLNIFAFLSPQKTTEEKLENASYYMSKQNESSYKKAMNIYSEIMTEDPYNSDAAYGYATAFAKYNEKATDTIGALPTILGLMADLQSADAIGLFQRLYASKEEARQKQLATYTIAKEVSDTLDRLARDIDNETYHGRVKSQDVWLDAVIAYIHRTHSTITTQEGQADAATILDLMWNPETQSIGLSVEGIAAWLTKNAEEKVAVLDSSKEALQDAIEILALHSGSEELAELSKNLDKVTAYFDNFTAYLEGL